jgi:hypothetical protein
MALGMSPRELSEEFIHGISSLYEINSNTLSDLSKNCVKCERAKIGYRINR